MHDETTSTRENDQPCCAGWPGGEASTKEFTQGCPCKAVMGRHRFLAFLISQVGGVPGAVAYFRG